MNGFWTKYGKKCAIIFYIFSLLTQISISLLVFPDLRQRIVMIVINFIITTATVFMGYKIANKMLGIKV
jgi:hypothetical protein